MRKNTLKYLIVLLFVFAAMLVYFVLKNDENSNSKKKISNSTQSESFQHKNEIDSTSKIEIPVKQDVKGKETSYIKSTKVSFQISGKLLEGEILFKKGTHFKTNDLLCKLDDEVWFLELAKMKYELIDELNSFYKKHLLDVDTLKWQKFIQSLDPENRLPSFPELSPKEKSLLSQTSILKLYGSVELKEEEFAYYYFLAPFDGEIMEIKQQVGKKIASHTVVMLIRKN